MNWLKQKRENRPTADAFPTLYTQRLVLRAFVPGDAADVYHYARSPVVGPYAGWPPHASLEVSRQTVDHFIRQGDVWAITPRKCDRVIGSISLHVDRKREVENARMLGYALGEDYWGQGYATEAAQAALRFAFEQLRCPVVSVYHFPFNTASGRVIRKLGFVAEGTLRRASTLPDGTVTDDVCYSLTREEYEARFGQLADSTAVPEIGNEII